MATPIFTAYQTRIENTVYLDVNTQFGLNGLRELVPNELAINNSLYNLLTTPLRSRKWRPTYGSQLPHLLQEPADSITAALVLNATFQAVKVWEPRIIMLPESTVDVIPPGIGFRVRIVYEIVLNAMRTAFTIEAFNTSGGRTSG